MVIELKHTNMKKLLLLITALFILASVNGQILRYSNYTAPVAATITAPDVLTTSKSVLGWYIADEDYITKAANDSISQWKDLSGYGYHLNSISGAYSIDWNSGGYVHTSTGAGLNTSAYTFSAPNQYIAVMRINSAGTSSNWFFGPRTGDAIRIRQNDSPYYGFYLRASTWWTVTAASCGSSGSTWQILVMVFNGSSSYVRINNNTPVTGDPGTGAPSGFRLGGDVATMAVADADYKEIIVANTLTSDDIDDIVTYLTTKYSIE